MDPALQIALVMLLSGAAGGAVNFLASDQDPKRLTWWQHVFVGVAAAFVVPLFLSMTSGHLLEDIAGDAVAKKAGEPLKLFVLAGFCLVAAASSRAFIQSVSERILAQVRAAKQTAASAKQEAAQAKTQAERANLHANEAKEVVAPLVEPDVPPSLQGGAGAAQAVTPDLLDEDDRAVMSSLLSRRYSLRTASGIARERRMSTADVLRVLESLAERGLVTRSVIDGRELWALMHRR